ncbi:MAG: hypothetical protein GY926_22115 [bacterium]|nr:hypothetical protein [bacterium]MCP4967917.1 hypothetical protein [bacterium]
MTDRRPEFPSIEVPADVAAAAGMPADLDANVLGPYEVPDPVRRRRAGVVYFVAAVATAVGIAMGLPVGMWLVVGMFVVIAAYHFAAGHHLAVKDHEALTIANKAMDFPVGHASAVLGFDGITARPIWNVLVFSADEPPSQRGLVRVDGRSAAIVETYTEVVPPAESMKTGTA